MSLYAYVCKYFKFPIGKPVIYVGDACQDKQAMLVKDGLMKCTIQPPRHLYHLYYRFAATNACYSASADPVPIEQNQMRTAHTKRSPKGR